MNFNILPTAIENGMSIKMMETVMRLIMIPNNNKRRETGKREQSSLWTSLRGEKGYASSFSYIFYNRW